MTYVIALFAGIGGAVAGWAAAAMIGLAIAAAIGLADGNGAAVMFAMAAVGPLGGVLGLLLGIYLALRYRGYRTARAIAWRGLTVLLATGTVAVVGLDLAGQFDDRLAGIGPKTVLEFEIRAPKGFAFASRGIDVELHTDRDRTTARLSRDARAGEDGHHVLAGHVDLRARTAKRVLVLSLPEQPRRLFYLELPAHPPVMREFGPWRHVDFLDDMKPDRRPRPAPATDGFHIRVRVAASTDAVR